MRNHRGLFRWALIAAIAIISVALQWWPRLGVFAAAEHLVKDPLHRLLASSQTEERIAVVDLDEASIAAVGPWPWPRSRSSPASAIKAANETPVFIMSKT